ERAAIGRGRVGAVRTGIPSVDRGGVGGGRIGHCRSVAPGLGEGRVGRGGAGGRPVVRAAGDRGHVEADERARAASHGARSLRYKVAMRPLVVALVAVASFASLATGRDARADGTDAQAHEAYERGSSAYRRGDYATAAREYAAADAL